jgi:hypothetical protein
MEAMMKFRIFFVLVSLGISLSAHATLSISTLEANVAKMKPTSEDSASAAAAKCKTLSTVAKARGVTVLVIGFEGLLSYSDTDVLNAYIYQEGLANSVKIQISNSDDGTNYLLHGLLIPLMTHYKGKVEFLEFPWDSQDSSFGSAPETCATEWMKVPGRRVILSGHSFGGQSVVLLADILASEKVLVDQVYTVDPRKQDLFVDFTRTVNVRRWDNYFELITPFLSGYEIDGATLNDDLSSEGYYHTEMPFAPVIYQDVVNHL